MFCAISGKPPSNPVISLSSKCVFEKALIEQYVNQNGRDPITNEPLQVSDLVEISMSPQQFSLSATLNSSTIANNYSIPNLLNTLHKEWDAVMLENFELRKQLSLCKKSLSDSLYRYDAVAKIAAKASMERDALKDELTQLTTSIRIDNPTASISDHKVVPKPNIEEQFELRTKFIEKMSTESQNYVTNFKKTKKKLQHFNSAFLADSKSIGNVDKCIPNLAVNLADRSIVAFNGNEVRVLGLRSLECNIPDDISYLVEFKGELFGMQDKCFIRYDQQSQASGFRYPVPSNIGTVKFIGYPTQITQSFFIFVNEHGQVSGFDVGSEKFFSISNFRLENGVDSLSYHKDGALLALSSSTREVYVLNLFAPDDEPVIFTTDFAVTEVKFGLNGYWMFVFGENCMNVYDLRKEPGTLAMDSIQFENNVDSVELDDTGKGMLICFGKACVSWYEYVKGSGFVEKTKFDIQVDNIQALVLNDDDDGHYSFRAILQNECITYELR